MPLSDAKTGMASALNRFFNSVAYPICLAALCAFSGLGGYPRYTALMSVIALCVIATALFSSDNKALIPPMFMSFYALGQDEAIRLNPGGGDVIAAYAPEAFAFVIFLGVVAVAVLMARFWMDGTLKAVVHNPGFFTASIVAMALAFLLNGAFSSHWKPINLLYGLLMALGFAFFYLLCSSIVRRSQNPTKYICQSLVFTCLLVLVQVVVRLWQLHAAGVLNLQEGILQDYQRSRLQLGWGIATTISGVLSLGIPVALYLASNYRFSGLYYGFALLLFAGVVFLGTRSATFIGGITLLVGMVLCCFGRNRRICRMLAGGLFACLGAGLVVCHFLWMPFPQLLEKAIAACRLQKLFSPQWLDGFLADDRFAMWVTGWEDFKHWPIFGVGFDKGAFPPELKLQNVYSNMYHCIFVQFFAATGGLGTLSYLLHSVQFSRLLIRKFTCNRMLVLLLPMMIVAMSLVDNFFFYLNFQIFYCVFLAVGEIDKEHFNEK